MSSSRSQTPCATALHLSAGFPPFPSSALSSLSHTLCDSCRRKPDESNMCQRAEHAREGSYKLILPASQRGNRKTAANISDCPCCQAWELLNSSSLVSPSQRADRTADRAQSTSTRRHSWPKKRLTATCTLVAWKSSPCVPSSIHAKPQNPTRSQQCPARGGTCEPQIA